MKTIRVVAAAIRDGEKIFATMRGYGDFKGLWEFPGGKIEPGETPAGALRRELEEELGVEVVPGDEWRERVRSSPRFADCDVGLGVDSVSERNALNDVKDVKHFPFAGRWRDLLGGKAASLLSVRFMEP